VKRLVIVAAFLAVACGGNKRTTETRGWSDHYAFSVTPDVIPPRAMEPIHFRVVVQDKKTGQPIETGEGRIFASSKDGANVDNGFTKEKEVGTYSARLSFPLTGDWAMALQFRGVKDPHVPLERIDWIQAVVSASEPGK
jgi:hypothetical protein